MTKLEKIIKVARGLEKADLVIKNANIINVLSEEILPETGGSFGGRNHSLKIQELKLFFFKKATAFLFHNQSCHGGL